MLQILPSPDAPTEDVLPRLSWRVLRYRAPQPKKDCSSSSEDTLRSPCVTTTSGRTCQPSFTAEHRLMLTLKHPSPSMNPATHPSSLSLSC